MKNTETTGTWVAVAMLAVAFMLHAEPKVDARLLSYSNQSKAALEGFALKWNVQREIVARVRAVASDAKKFSKDAASEGSALLPFTLNISAERFTTPAYDGIKLKIYENTGGAHGNTTFRSYTVNADGKTQTLQKVLSAHALTEEQFLSAVNEQLKAALQKAGAPPKKITTLETISAWNIPAEKTIRITFNPYVVAPYAAGPITIEVPTK